ncbi:MAG TPA: ABC transporter ATP-binding protein, partial [Flavobacteriaceae bacterium]|nr:ABC transporter ATP-binding protein [Flavobacteriaceae bacterium]
MKSTNNILVNVEDLRIAFRNTKKLNEVVHGVSFQVKSNEILGIVGESGSGKSVTALALMGLLPKKNCVITGKLTYRDLDLLKISNKQWQEIRSNKIAMVFQEPMSALNPSIHCGKQVIEVLLQHSNLSVAEAKKEVLRLFEQVRLPDQEKIYNSYPHEISGGQMQRVVIAMAIACKPDVLIADEPTTALDVTVQKEILQLLKDIQQETKMGMVFISHDLNVVSEIADQVLVMYQGNAVEYGSTEQVFKHPKNDYTKALLLSKPSDTERLVELPTIKSLQEDTFKSQLVTPQARAIKHRALYTQEPILKIKNLVKSYPISKGLFRKSTSFKAVNDVSFSIYPGETVGLVGESGCGKSTLAKAIMQLEPVSEGSIWYRGKNVTHLKGKALKEFRKEVQLIFQDPFASLNPKMKIGDAIVEPMQAHRILDNNADRIKR